MPWKECSVMDERLRFVAKLLDGESMSEVCREFGSPVPAVASTAMWNLRKELILDLDVRSVVS